MPKKYPFRNRAVIYSLMFHPLHPEVRRPVYDEALYNFLWRAGYRLITAKILQRRLSRLFRIHRPSTHNDYLTFRNRVKMQMSARFIDFSPLVLRDLLEGEEQQIHDEWIVAIAAALEVPAYSLYSEKKPATTLSLYYVKHRKPEHTGEVSETFVLAESAAAARVIIFEQVFFAPYTSQKDVVEAQLDLIRDCEQVDTWKGGVAMPDVRQAIRTYNEAKNPS